jgi:oligosaccharide repeat unit polymerase
MYEKDIFAPPVILSAVYLISVASAIFNANLYKFKDISIETVFIITLGILVFVVTSLLIKQNYMIKEKSFNSLLNQPSLIQISRPKLIFAILLSIICTFIYTETIGNAVNLGQNMQQYSEAMAEFREDYSYDNKRLPFYSLQIHKLSRVLAFVFLYVFGYNVAISRKIWNNAVYLIPVLLFCFASLRGANRTPLIQIIIAGVIYWYITKNKISNKKSHIKLIFSLLFGVCIFFYIFTLLRPYVGRRNEMDIVNYITFYAGGSIHLFDIFCQNPEESKIFGWETFAGLYQDLSKIGIYENRIMHMDFREISGVQMGNIYTAFRTYYQDFGLSGIVVFQIIQALIYTIWYEKLKQQPNVQFSFSLVVYGILTLPLFEHSIQEQLFRNYFCLNTLIVSLLCYVLGRFFITNSAKVKF